MAQKNRVRQVGSGSGTGSLNLDSTPSGLQSFVNAYGDSGVTWGLIIDTATGAWEVSRLTVTDSATDTVARGTVIENSSGNTSKINFSAGTKEIFSYVPPQCTIVFGSVPSLSDGDSVAVVSGEWQTRTPAQMRAIFDLEIGTDVQAYDVMLTYISALNDPNADRIMFWDDSAGAITWLTAGTGLAITTTTISLSFLGLEALTDPNADRIAFWDDSAGAFAWLALSGLTVTGTTLAVDAASDTAAGKVELATAAETTTGTDTGRAVTPDGLAGSIFGQEVVQILVTDPNGSAISTGDGKAYFTIPAKLNGMNLVAAHAAVTTVSSSGTPTIQIHNVTDTADMLSTRITIDANEKTSYTAAAAPVINGSADDVATGDILRIDVDVAGTGTKGLMVLLTFQLP